MCPIYYVVLRIKAQTNFDCFGRFLFGHDKALADRVFELMMGSNDVDESMPIQLDFIEMVNGVPVTLHIIACTLEQLSFNVKMMTLEAFKHLNLHGQ